MKKKKYKPGPLIKTVGQVDALVSIGIWIYLFDRPKHPAFIDSMTLRTIRYFIRQKSLRVADLNQ